MCTYYYNIIYIPYIYVYIMITSWILCTIQCTYYILVLHILLHIYIYTVYVHIVIVCSYIWDIYRICIIDILRSKMDRENYKL